MIIITYDPNIEVGKQYHNGSISDENCVDHFIPFLVIRESNFEEYKKQCNEYKSDIGDILEGARYYEILVD